MKSKPTPPHGRYQPPTWRRQFNESFCNPNGLFSPFKAISLTGQLSALVHFNINFLKVIENEWALLIILGMIIAPDTVRKVINMRYDVKGQK